MSGKVADVEQKLANVEHQLETAKVEVTKPFPQEAELSEKLERIAEHEKSRMLADSSSGRVSVKEKLAEMSARLGKDKAGVQKPDMAKIKGKEESL